MSKKSKAELLQDKKIAAIGKISGKFYDMLGKNVKIDDLVMQSIRSPNKSNYENYRICADTLYLAQQRFIKKTYSSTHEWTFDGIFYTCKKCKLRGAGWEGTDFDRHRVNDGFPSKSMEGDLFLRHTCDQVLARKAHGGKKCRQCALPNCMMRDSFNFKLEEEFDKLGI